MKQANWVALFAVLLTLSPASFAGGLVTYFDCKNQDGTMSYRIFPCDKNQTEVQKFNVDLDERARLESRKSTAGPYHRSSNSPSVYSEANKPTSSGSTKSVSAPSSSYGSCSERAEIYKRSYENGGNPSDLVCLQKALERELSGAQSFSCPHSAQHYKTAYEASANPSDLACLRQTLVEELSN